jgi:hypothetical protein
MPGYGMKMNKTKPKAKPALPKRGQRTMTNKKNKKK